MKTCKCTTLYCECAEIEREAKAVARKIGRSIRRMLKKPFPAPEASKEGA